MPALLVWLYQRNVPLQYSPQAILICRLCLLFGVPKECAATTLTPRGFNVRTLFVWLYQEACRRDTLPRGFNMPELLVWLYQGVYHRDTLPSGFNVRTLLVWLHQRNVPLQYSPQAILICRNCLFGCTKGMCRYNTRPRRFLIKNENVPPYGDTPSIYPDYGPSAGDLRSIKLARISVYGNID